jgi:signal transduction histidine kinase
MRKRIFLAVIGVATGALLLSGLLTLGIERAVTRNQIRQDLIEQANSIATTDAPVERRQLLRVLRTTLRLQDAELVVINAQGQVTGAVPGSVANGNKLDIAALRAGETISGITNRQVWAAAPLSADLVRRNDLAVVILTRDVSDGSQPAGVWFFLSAVGVLVLAAVVANRLSRRITQPVEATVRAAQDIATGDLTARIPPNKKLDPELVSLTDSINSMAESLERAKSLERNFLLSVSHDLRTPLTSIRGYAEALADGTVDDAPRVAAIVESEARRLDRLVRDLLDLAKLDARSFSFDVRAIDLREIVEDTAEGFRQQAESLQLSLEVVGLEQPAWVLVDPDRVAQIVANLTENALKYAATTIYIRIDHHQSTNGPTVSMSIANDGPSIPPDELPRVFDRLYRSDRIATRERGTGLGLAIVHELATALGGTVGMESPVAGWNSGARAVVTFPVVAQPQAHR